MNGDASAGSSTPALDPVALWGDAQARVCELVLDLSAEEVRRTVPATPDWTVRELLAHMIGLGADVLAGNEDAGHAPEWTAAQVDARAEKDVAALVAEWRGFADDLQAHMREHGARPLADLMIHEQDLRGAVGRHGAQSDRGHAWVSRRMLTRIGDALADGPTLALISPSGAWTSSEGGPEQAEVVIRASDFDIARALTSRRTEDQLRAWTERGELATVKHGFTQVGPLPDRELPC